MGERWRRRVNGQLKLYRYRSLDDEQPDVIDLDLENGVFPLLDANGGDDDEPYRFFRLGLE